MFSFAKKTLVKLIAVQRIRDKNLEGEAATWMEEGGRGGGGVGGGEGGKGKEKDEGVEQNEDEVEDEEEKKE